MAGRDSRTSQAVIFILVFSICMCVIGASYMVSKNTVRRLDEPLSLNCSSLQNVQVVGDRVYYIDQGTLRCLDSGGNELWPHSLGEGVSYRAYESGIIAWRDSQLYILDNNGKLVYNNSMGGTIGSCTLSRRYAAIEVQADYSSSITVIDLAGNVTDKLDVTGLTVLDYGFFSNDTMLWTMTLNTEGTVPLTQVNTYQPGKIQTGAISDTDQVIYGVNVQRNDLMLVGTYYMDKYTYTGKKDTAARTLVYGWYMQDSFSNDQRSALVFVPTSQIETPVAISDLRILYNGDDMRIHLPVDCLGVLAGESAAYAFNSQYLFKCTYGERYPTAYALNINVDRVLGITSSNMAAVISEQQAYLLQLP